MKPEVSQSNVDNPSSHLTGNTSHLRYKAQPVNAVYCGNHTQHTLCGQDAEFRCVKAGGAYSDHWALKGQLTQCQLDTSAFYHGHGV
jgi:hypothetical protein